MKKINVAIIGMKFGKEFIKIYQNHPNVDKIAICQRNADDLAATGEEFGIPENLRFTDYKQVAACDEIDAVHVISPVPEHVKHTLECLNANKHVACTVPMATSIEDLHAICEAKEKSGKIYMMMETAVYTREYLYVENLVKSGQMGNIQFVRGSHMQDMGLEGWAEYWLGLPPFWYGTHAIAPLLLINKAEAEYVVGHGSGKVSADLASRYGSPFAIETVTLKLKDSDVCAEATRSLFDTIRQYRESFDVYGTKMTFEWDQIEDEGACLFEGGESARRISIPDAPEPLIDELKAFTKRGEVVDKDNVSFIQGAGHGGSHPHLVQEFVSSIIEGREPLLNAKVSANICAAGILGHESCLKGGEKIYIPKF